MHLILYKGDISRIATVGKGSPEQVDVIDLALWLTSLESHGTQLSYSYSYISVESFRFLQVDMLERS